MAEVYMIASPLSTFLKGIAVLLLIICGIIYIYSAKKREKSKENLIIYGFGFFFFIYAIFCTLLGFLIPFQLNLVYRDGIFYGNLENPTKLFYIFHKLTVIVFFIGTGMGLHAMERVVKKTKYCLTISNVIILIVDLILPWELHLEYYTFLMFINLINFYIMMILLAKWSSIEFKAIAIIMIGGMSFLALGPMLMTLEILSLNFFPLYLGPIIIIIGCLVTVSPMIIKPKSFSGSLSYWYIIGFMQFLIIISWAMFSVLFLPFQLKIMFTIIAFVNIFFISKIIKDIKSQQSIDIVSTEKITETPSLDFLKTFSKPERISEEEVTISKEKRICLVCKGKISGHTYVCLECETFYCNKCYNALTNLENACWACETQFDVSKPVKSFEKEEELEEIELSEKSQKTPKMEKDK
jgi:hypothetical protein